MPSRSATSLVDMTSVRVSGRAAGVAIYLREARSSQSGPPGADSGWRLLAYKWRAGVLSHAMVVRRPTTWRAATFRAFRHHARKQKLVLHVRRLETPTGSCLTSRRL
jgi:hypothetical protein